MRTIVEILEQQIAAAMSAVTGEENCPAIVKPTADPKFGDYQANGAMGLAKRLKTNPRRVAEQVVAKLDLRDICESPDIAGPGFINLRLSPGFLSDRLLETRADPIRLGIEAVSTPQTIVVDFSSPNVAKQMHVGHLRSTIIGDSICRMLEFEGHRVIRQNHIGDWGTQFGMLIQHLFEQASFLKDDKHLETFNKAMDEIEISDLESFYREAKSQFDLDETFRRQSRKRVVELQSGDEASRVVWKKIASESRRHYQPIYNALSVRLTEADECGESFYNDMLAPLVQDLQERGLARLSDGAICVFPEGFVNKEGDPLPFIIQKSDGGFLYATTDLAANRYRSETLRADAIVYVTDARQKLHFEMLFHTVRAARWTDREVDLAHVTFGTVLGADGTPLKTRSGDSIKLKDLLDEAVARAGEVVEQKSSELPAEQKAAIARAVGIGAVKYADYSNNRTSDYVFDFDKMLAMEGNTAPYMQYAYARVQSIGRKAAGKGIDVDGDLAGLSRVHLAEPEELELAKHLVRYGDTIKGALVDYRPNYLTTYLYELAQKFSRFYASCPVLAADDEQRPSRLLLCDLTARTIKHGLTQLLGIEVVEQM